MYNGAAQALHLLPAAATRCEGGGSRTRLVRPEIYLWSSAAQGTIAASYLQSHKCKRGHPADVVSLRRRQDTKELKLRPGTEVHDYDVRVRSAQKFISKAGHLLNPKP